MEKERKYSDEKKEMEKENRTSFKITGLGKCQKSQFYANENTGKETVMLLLLNTQNAVCFYRKHKMEKTH